jgi:soluble lytic murein transglycosylase
MVSDNIAEKVQLFEKALSSSNIFIRQAAAEELAVLMSQGTELSAKTIQTIRKEASGWWAEAFNVIKNAPNREKALLFLFSSEQNAPASFSEARLFTLREYAKWDIFSGYEKAAIEGHYAVSRSRHNDSVNFFRAFQVNGEWPAQLPKLFIEYPNLINDLGRAFQFSQFGREGQTLFLQWERSLSRESTFDDLRYRLLLFAGRITRRMGSGHNTQAIYLFERALLLAPDYEQQDACIWYILDLSMSGPINIIMDRMERLVPRWHNGSHFNNILERYLHRLVSANDWRRIVRTYDLIKDTDAVLLKAGFAWVIARIIEEDYLSADDRSLAARAAQADNDSALASAFFRISYNAVDNLHMPGIYYRMQSAKALDLPFLVFSDEPIAPSNDTPKLQFLLNFFKYDAAHLSTPFIRAKERQLTPDELRAVSIALNEAGMYPLSMRLISFYLNNDGYVRNRRDLELMYPRPFLELIERNAEQFDIPPSLLFGLIRTESAFQTAVVSHAGAVGLSQLMPATAREQADRIRRRGGPDFFCPENNIDSTDPSLNVYIGSFYYNYLMSRFNNNEQLALMSYNGGQSRVRRWRTASSLPADLFVETAPIFETRDYGRRVPAIGKIYEELYYR